MEKGIIMRNVYEQALPAVPAGFAVSPGKAEEHSYNVTPLSFKRGALNIDGTFYLPDIEKPPVAIISHGLGGTRLDVERCAEILAGSGIAAYIFDYCGGGPESRSDGSMLDMSVLTEKADLNAVLDGIKKLPAVNSGNIFLVGGSQGGFVSAMVARDRPDEIRALVLYFPAFVIPDEARKLFPSFSQISDTTELFGLVTVGRRYVEDVYNMDAYKEITPYNHDVLIFHGDKDLLVPVSYSERALKEYASAKLVIVKGSGHAFYRGNKPSESDIERTSRKTAAFIEAHVK